MNEPYTAVELRMMRMDLNLLKKATELTAKRLENFASYDAGRDFGKFIDDLSAHRRKEALMLEEQIVRIEDMMRQIGSEQNSSKDSTAP